MVERAFSISSPLISRMVTLRPPEARAWPMPEPMTPPPRMPALLISMGMWGTSSQDWKREVGRRKSGLHIASACFLLPSTLDLSSRKYTPARVARLRPQLLLDAQEAVVLRRALAAGGGPALDLAAARRHRQVGDRRALGLAAAVRHNAGPARRPRRRHRRQRLRQRPDLVHLDQHRVGRALRHAAADALHVRHEHVVPHQLQARPQPLREVPPAR